MKTRQGTAFLQQAGTILLLGVAYMLGSSAPVHALSGVNNIDACYDCHGSTGDIRPLDTPPGSLNSYRNISTGDVKGNHRTHIKFAVTTYSSTTTCAACHGPTANSLYHRDGKIQISANINTSPVTAQYRGGITFTNQTSVPLLGTCSNVNCHFERVTPTWGDAPYSTIANCSGCHAAPPTTGTSNAHATHGTYTSANNANATFKFNSMVGCAKCHSDYVTAINFSHATSAGKAGSKINVKLTEGTYSGNGLNYLPSQSGSRVFGQCSAVYCHSPGTLSSAYAAPKVLPTWGVALGCNGCHDNNSTATTLTAKHLIHVGGTTNYAFGCEECHSATVSNSTTISSVVNHVDKLVTVSFKNRSAAISGIYNGTAASSPSKSTRAPSAVPATAYCNNTYCHSQGRSSTNYSVAGFKAMSTPSWGANLPTGLRSCSACHGGDSTNNTIQRQITSIAHRIHVGGTASSMYAIGCADCHSLTVSSNTAILDKTKHANFQKNVDISGTYGGTYSGNLALPGATPGTCSNVYCHSNGQATAYVTQTWNNTALTCTSCHGNATSNTLSAPHNSHVNNTVAAIGVNYACVDCHAQVVVNDTTFTAAGRALHTNKLVNYSGAKSGKLTGFAYSTTMTCSVSYCHTSGKKTKLLATAEPAAPTWAAATFTCASCHGAATGTGTFVSIAGEPNYKSGKMGSYTANTHQRHVAAAADCYNCHNTTVDAAGALTATGNHINRTIQVASAKFTYTAAARTCGSWTGGCHGSGTPTWGGAPLTCLSCHDISTSTAHMRHSGLYVTSRLQVGTPVYLNMTANISTGSDTNGTTFKQYGMGCGLCHPISAGSSHANGTYDITLNGVAGDGTLKQKTTGATTTGTISLTNSDYRCKNVYCHSNGKAPYTFGNTSTWRYAYKPSDRCSMCHGNAPAGTAHDSHVGSLHNDDIYKGYSSGRMPAAGPVGYRAGHGDPAQATTISCYLCHNLTTTATRNKYATGCNTAACHNNATGNNADATGAIWITNTAKHVNGTVEVQFAGTNVRTKAQLRDSAFKWYTGGVGGWIRQGTYKKGTGASDLAKNPLTSGTYSSGTCSNIACHPGPAAVNWTTNYGQGANCVICHTEL